MKHISEAMNKGMRHCLERESQASDLLLARRSNKPVSEKILHFTRPTHPLNHENTCVISPIPPIGQKFIERAEVWASAIRKELCNG